jgi:hypothetical protein
MTTSLHFFLRAYVLAPPAAHISNIFDTIYFHKYVKRTFADAPPDCV